MFRAAFLLVMLLSTTALADVTPAHVSPKPLSLLMAKETECLTTAIAREAPDESATGKLAVATVIMNRFKTKGFPKTVCGVIYAKGQFSWTRFKRLPPLDSTVYRIAHQIAQEVVQGGKRLQSLGNSLYFHTIDCKPNWDHVRLVQTIGHHEFFAATGN